MSEYIAMINYITFVVTKIESVSDCCSTPTQQLLSYIMARTSYFSMRWRWGPLCARPTRL